MSSHVLLVGLFILGASAALIVVVVLAVGTTAEAAAPPEPVPGKVIGQLLEEPAAQQVVLRRPEAMRIPIGHSDEDGEPMSISCSTCHAMLEPQPGITVDDLDEFHQGMHFQHGSNSCLSCHDPDDYDSLRLADGRQVPATASIELCSQCHGPQRRDFDRGAHGGMTGYWQLASGGRIRNTCVNCHDAHVPAYQGAVPVPGPRDRFLVPAGPEHGGAHE